MALAPALSDISTSSNSRYHSPRSTHRRAQFRHARRPSCTPTSSFPHSDTYVCARWRVLDSNGRALRRVYASGRATTGARGVLALTMLDTYAVADKILSDYQVGGAGGSSEYDTQRTWSIWRACQGGQSTCVSLRIWWCAYRRVFRTFAVCEDSQVAPVDVDSRRSLCGNLDALIPTDHVGALVLGGGAERARLSADASGACGPIACRALEGAVWALGWLRAGTRSGLRWRSTSTKMCIRTNLIRGLGNKFCS